VEVLGPVPAPSPTAPAPGSVNVGEVAGDVVHGLWAGLTSSAWSIVVLVALGTMLLTHAVHELSYPRSRRDPTRLFSRADKALILARAGHRCEHHTPIAGRCKQTRRLQADHVVPWSRGGPTIVSNGQALCAVHNREKSARVPYRWQLRALHRRRASYYPYGANEPITRRLLRPEDRAPDSAVRFHEITSPELDIARGS
jgi:hypothetical protein